jgi:phage baseplate assembly protein V
MRSVIKSLSNRLGAMLARGVVSLADPSTKMQSLSVSLLNDEDKTAVEHFEPYGFTSRPHPGAEVVMVFLDGDRSNGMVVCAADRRYRIANLADGEVAIHDDQGAAVKLTRTGIVIDGGSRDIHINGAPNVIVTNGTVKVTGGDVIADGISLKTHKHGGVTTGTAQTGTPV